MAVSSARRCGYSCGRASPDAPGAAGKQLRAHSLRKEEICLWFNTGSRSRNLDLYITFFNDLELSFPVSIT
jgi:hypothetical protein